MARYNPNVMRIQEWGNPIISWSGSSPDEVKSTFRLMGTLARLRLISGITFNISVQRNKIAKLVIRKINEEL